MHRILVSFEEAQLTRIERFRRGGGASTRVGAIRRLVDRGLDRRDPLAAAIRALRAKRRALARMGITHAAVFGSVARGDARADSDVDVFIEFEPGCQADLFAYLAIQEKIRTIVTRATGRRADVIEIDSLRPRARDMARIDAVYAF